jgi:hypothetical protein
VAPVEVPPELARVLDRMLAKDPAQRQQSPAEVADDLAPFVRPVSPPAPPEEVLPLPLEEPTPRLPARRRRLAGAVGAAALVAAALVALAIGLTASRPGAKRTEDDRKGEVADHGPAPVSGKGESRKPEPPPAPRGAEERGAVGVAIPAPPLQADRVEVILPEPAGQVRTGGGGRYLVFRLPKARKLAVFDVAKARVVHQIDVDDDTLYAAGLDSLVVVMPGQKLLQRWSLDTFERSPPVPFRSDAPFRIAAMGSASRGPLLLWGGGAVTLWDVPRLEPLKVQGKVLSGDANPQFNFQVRAAADGRHFVGWHGGLFPFSFALMRLDDDEATLLGSPSADGFNGHWALPGPDGRLHFRYGAALFDAALRPVVAAFEKDSVALPTEDPRFFLVLHSEAKNADRVTIYTAADRRPVVTVHGLECTTASQLFTNWGLFQGEPRLRFLPSAKVLLTLPETNDRVVLRRLDLDEALKRQGEDYLVVLSAPPLQAELGDRFAYRLDVRSGAGGVPYRLDQGPEDMKVSDDGLLSWTVPRGFTGKTAPVLVTVRDAGGKEVFHRFDLALVQGPRKRPGR